MDVLDLQNEYNTKFELLSNRISNYQYIFEITKLCGHGEFLTIHKKQTLLDLYKIVSLFYYYEYVLPHNIYFVVLCHHLHIYSISLPFHKYLPSHTKDYY